MNMSKKSKVLDLFCGCGGISEGFRLAGFDIVGGIDFNQDAVNTFQHNFKSARIHCIDITTMSNEEILKEYHGVDVIVGGPPCQGFSTANRHLGHKEDPRNKLFFEYLRFVKVLKPKVIMIENVRGLLTHNNGYAKKCIEEILGAEGYLVNMKVLNASDYGVPQNRFRAIIVGIRKDCQNKAFDFETLRTLPKVTVEDAIGELYRFEKGVGKTIALKDKPSTPYRKYLRADSGIVLDHEARYPAEKVQKRVSYIPQGGNWAYVPKELWPTNRNNRFSTAYKRLSEDKQSCTIDTGNAHSNYFHPLFNRIPSIRESARLQSFPDSFEFTGNRGGDIGKLAMQYRHCSQRQ